MTTPRATLRLQFHRGFTFADAEPLAEYFAALGVSHVYASPIMTARPGSMHGYDVIDPGRINPELGGENAFRQFVAELRRHDLGLILDIVPNHMATGSANPWWMDVLAHGRDSRYAKYFDIDWEPPNAYLRGKVLLPILGRPYGEAIESGELTIGDENGRCVVRYFDHILPVADGQSSSASFDMATPHGRQQLHALLERQHYRLAWWRTANDEINWRRFFDINELAALRIEDNQVFEAVHDKMLRLYAEGLIDGVRVDHVDGLSQPESYCRKLRARLNALADERPKHLPTGPAYFVVEKILARDESLLPEWQTDGTTGYDFMDQVSALQHHEGGEEPLRLLWERLSGRPGGFAVEEDIARRQIMERSFAAQRCAVVASLHTIAQRNLTGRDYAREAIRRCLMEILAHFPVYRIYTRVGQTSAPGNVFLAHAVARAGETCLPSDRALVATLGSWLSGNLAYPHVEELQNIALARFQQLSAPLCAKSVEDTAFYRYGRLISRNDVGFDARRFACSTGEFHRLMENRAARLPHAMLATATHDHKRGEDVRARLAVLSEISEEWAQAVERWIAAGTARRRGAGNGLMPGNGDLAILFQTIVGSWPLDLKTDDRSGLAAYSRRIAAWQQKALREAKLHSDWSAPNEPYERAVTEFIEWLLAPASEILSEIAAFARRIAPAGATNGLAQTLIKLTAPGVPDIYQGTEYWDFSLVDPDNRAPVDFAARQRSLVSGADTPKQWRDGSLKQFVTARALGARKSAPDLFANGTYLPLHITGPNAHRVFAFARQWRGSVALVAVCRFMSRFVDDEFSLPILHCSETCFQIPQALFGTYANAFSLETTRVVGSEIQCAEIFKPLPVALLVRNTARE